MRLCDRAMHEEVIAHMRARIGQVRRVMALAHDPGMIEALQKVIDSSEADIDRLRSEAEAAGRNSQAGQ